MSGGRNLHKAIVWIIGLILLCSFVYAWSGENEASYYKADNNYLDNLSHNHLTDTSSTSFGTNAKPQGDGNYSFTCSTDMMQNLTWGNPTFNASHVLTISYWYNATAWNGDDIIFSLGTTYPNMLWLGADGGGANSYARHYNGGIVWALSYAKPTLNVWNHIVVLMGTGGVQIFMNGAIVTNNTGVSTLLPSTYDRLYICDDPAFSSFDGRVDNVFIDSVRWTADNVTTAYNGGNAINHNPPAAPIPIDTGIMNITLDAPHTGVTNTSLSQNFSYLPIDWNEDFENCSLLVNSTGVWAYNLTDDSVTNDTINKFSNVEFEENEQSGTDVLWNIECEDAGGDINSSAVNWTIHFETDTIINNIYLTSTTPDQELEIGDVGNTTDTTPTFNQTTNKEASCYIGTDNASWTICSTTDATGSICTIGSALDYGPQSIYFTCNSTLTNIDYAERLVSVFSIPNVTDARPSNNTAIVSGTGTIEFNATIIDYTNTTLNCNLTNATEVVQTNTSVNNNSIVRFYQTLGSAESYNWSITCSNGYYEGTSGNMNLSIKVNKTQQRLCSYIKIVEFYPNVTNYNWTTGHLNQLNVLAENTTRCGFTYNLSIGVVGDLQISLNITFNETFVPMYRGIPVNESWVTIDNVTVGQYLLNVTGSYINATSDSPTFEDYMRVI